jgi:hypothetical protein
MCWSNYVTLRFLIMSSLSPCVVCSIIVVKDADEMNAFIASRQGVHDEMKKANQAKSAKKKEAEDIRKALSGDFFDEF